MSDLTQPITNPELAQAVADMAAQGSRASREAVLDHRTCICGCEDLFVDLIILKYFLSLLFLRFLTHGSPCVRDHDIRAGCCHERVCLQGKFICVALCELKDFSVRLITVRCRNCNIHADL